ncbi:FAD-dependent oxidoreductase [Anianabacter salinae]|uniref:FAD-dependent oxidoreductase n=1 Tax=Anianabacter salinae TaxID=2851023 RepID=UPI00225E6AA1|nr:FAD-dependent oxidoreductase [Anianabacter salinae]MBV0911594.1 FAD-dependent monooxygenase [Anianabacter salinae]
MLIGQDITVIGAGVAGLAVATALAHRGAAVTVLERAPAITEVGAGLQISPNGFAVLEALGLGAEVRGAAARSTGVRLIDGPSGRDVLHLDLARHAPDRTFLLIHRADLIGCLFRAAQAAGVTVRTGTEVAEIRQDRGRSVLTTTAGETVSSSLLIGADGLHSGLRARLNGSAAPRFTGQVAWRALVPAPPGTPPEAQVHMGPGRHAVTYPLRGGTLLNIVAVEERDGWAEEGWHIPGNPDEMRRAFAGFHPWLRARLDEAEAVHLWGLFRHPVAPVWHDGASAILGDAAHPTLPFLAQGANLALEDAWVLADLLARTDTPDALALYQARRRPRVIRAIEAANGNARNYHLQSPFVRRAAHTALRLGGRIAPTAALRRFEWLYGLDVTADE